MPERGLGRLLVGAEEKELVNEVFDSQQLFRFGDFGAGKSGSMVERLEKEATEVFGVRHALGVTSGTAALETALGALGIGPGDEVIVPAWSWTSCFTSIVRMGARPVLAEIDQTLCLAPQEIDRLHSPRTKAVLVVHFQGVAADMDPILALAKSKSLAVLEDCAESPGALYKGRRVGSLGDIGIYSFQNQKTITSGEGGLVVTNNERLFERAVRMHDLGQMRPYFKKFITPIERHFCGSQFRLNELTAAVALAQLRKLDSIRNHCRAITKRLTEKAGPLPLEKRRIPDPTGDSGFENYFFAPTTEVARQLHAILAEHNVTTAPLTGTYAHYHREYCQQGLTHHPLASPFEQSAPLPAKGYRAEDFPQTEALVWRMLPIPIGVKYTLEDADYIAAVLKAACQKLLPSL